LGTLVGELYKKFLAAMWGTLQLVFSEKAIVLLEKGRAATLVGTGYIWYRVTKYLENRPNGFEAIYKLI